MKTSSNRWDLSTSNRRPKLPAWQPTTIPVSCSPTRNTAGHDEHGGRRNTECERAIQLIPMARNPYSQPVLVSDFTRTVPIGITVCRAKRRTVSPNMLIWSIGTRVVTRLSNDGQYRRNAATGSATAPGRRPVGSRGNLSRALEADCRNVEVWSLLGATSMSMGRWPEAIEQLRAALTLAPQDVAVLDNLGIALAQSGRHAEAIAAFEQALKIDANHGATYDHLGTVLGQIGRLDEAVANFQTACRLMPDNAEAHFKLGVTFEKLGRFTAAAGSFRRALECAPQRRYSTQPWLGVGGIGAT